MSSDLTPFLFEDLPIRAVTNGDDEPWFVLSDILSAMGSATNVSNARASIEAGLGVGFSNDIPIDTNVGRRIVTIVAEAAATYLLSRSNTEQGRKLNRFIHAEVLPAIRKTGKYAVPSPVRTLSPDAQIANDIDAKITLALKYGVPEAHALTQAAQAADRASGTKDWTSLLSQSRCLTGPVDSDRLLEPTDLGRLFGISGKAMNQILKRAGWQTPRGGSWEPTAKGGHFAHNHQWVNSNKAGYNLKWSLQAVENLLQNNPQLLYGA